jgi:hypothetical protein
MIKTSSSSSNKAENEDENGEMGSSSTKMAGFKDEMGRQDCKEASGRPRGSGGHPQ